MVVIEDDSGASEKPQSGNKPTGKHVDTLIEQLAAIEHERWADWQNWVHKVYLEGNFGDFMLRWQKQIATPYSELSEAEKQSDRDQVKRYWPLITQYIAKENRLARIETFRQFYVDYSGYLPPHALKNLEDERTKLLSPFIQEELSKPLTLKTKENKTNEDKI